MNIFVLFLHSFSYILNNAKLTVWISYYERKHGKEEKIPKLPHPNLQITFKSRKNGETTRIWFVISFSKVNSPTIHLLFRRQRKFSKLVLFFKKKCLVFLVAGQLLVGMVVKIFLRWDFWFRIVWTKSWTKRFWVTWPFMERVLHSGSLAPHKRTNCSVFTNVSNSILWIDCIGKGPIKPGGQNWTQNWGDFQPMAAYWGESVANMTNVLHDIFAVCYQPYLYQ